MPRRLPRPTLLALTAVLLLAGPASAQEDKVSGAARTASVMAAIVRYCPAYFVVDGPKALKLGTAGYELAHKWAPPGRAKGILEKEGARRTREVEATGARYWCQNQREVHRNLGAELFLN